MQTQESRKKIVLHIGYSKCGSTTLQETLSCHSELLREGGILFPRTVAESPAWLRFFWESELPASRTKESVARKKRQFLRELREEIYGTSAECVFLSDEGLVSLSSDAVERLEEFFRFEFPDFSLTILAVVRAPTAFFTSRCQQFIANRYFTKTSVREYLEGKVPSVGESRSDNIAMNPNFVFSRNLGNYMRIFDQVHVVSFEDAVSSEVGFSHFLLNEIGHDVIIEDQRENTGKSINAIELIGYINQKVPFSLGALRRGVRRFDDLKPLYLLSGDKFRLSDELMNIVNGKVKSEIDWLRNTFGIDYSDDLVLKKGFDGTPNWNESFASEIKEIFPELNWFARALVCSYIREAVPNYAFASTSRIALEEALFWMNQKYWLFVVIDYRFFVYLTRGAQIIRAIASAPRRILLNIWPRFFSNLR